MHPNEVKLDELVKMKAELEAEVKVAKELKAEGCDFLTKKLKAVNFQIFRLIAEANSQKPEVKPEVKPEAPKEKKDEAKGKKRSKARD